MKNTLSLISLIFCCQGLAQGKSQATEIWSPTPVEVKTNKNISLPPEDAIILFDGKDISHWRGFKQSDFPFDGWSVENTTLKTIVGGNKVDIITKKKYKDFEI